MHDGKVDSGNSWSGAITSQPRDKDEHHQRHGGGQHYRPARLFQQIKTKQAQGDDDDDVEKQVRVDVQEESDCLSSWPRRIDI